MYYIIDSETGNRHPCAVAPRATIRNLREVFSMLDAGTDPCVAHAEYANGDTMDVEIPSNYARNSIGRKTRIRGNELFIKRLNVDLSYLARYEWGRTHQWDENELGSWTDAIGVPFDETLADRDIATRLQPVFPKSDIAGWLDLYSIRRGWAPVPSTSELIRALLHERENAPLRQHRPANSGIAYETFDSGYGEMGVARDKRTGQTWMWPMDEERDRYIRGWFLGRDQNDRMDRHEIRMAMDEELRRGGLPEQFDYPCHAPDGEPVWCRWDVQGGPDYAEDAIMMGEKPDARKIGTLTRRTDGDGLRWWQWTDTDGNQGKPSRHTSRRCSTSLTRLTSLSATTDPAGRRMPIHPPAQPETERNHMDTERVMERVRRLLAIANDPAASDNEQRIALEQAQRLMDRHAIEEWQLEEDHDDVEIIERRIRLETNPCNRYMAQLANIVAHGNRCRAAYECRRAGNGRDVVSTVWIYGARVDVDKTESIWTAMETSRAAMWRERARTTPRAKANAAWRNGYYRGFQEEIARRYEILRREMESDGTGRELITVRGSQVDRWVETHVTFISDKPKLSKATRPSQAAYRHGRQDGARQAIGLKETGQAGNWTLEK